MKHSHRLRRLACALTVAVVWTDLIAAPCPSRAAAPAPLTTSSPLAIDPATRELGKRFGITLIVHDPPAHRNAGVTTVPLRDDDAPALRRYLTLFREEFRKYPPAFVRATGLKTIVFVRSINNRGQVVGACPDFAGNAVFYEPYRGAAHPIYQRHVVHHEFFHLADYALSGEAFLTEPYWAALNPPAFRYGSGGRNATTSDQFAPTDEQPGFVNRYSTSGIEEDRAEIFATAWIPSEAALMRRRAGRGDEVLRLKIAYMRGLIDHYATEPKTPAERRGRDVLDAVRRRDQRRAAELVEADASVATAPADWLGRTPLHWAAMLKDPRMVAWLLDRGAQVGRVDENGWTALHVSAFLGDETVARLLLAAGADPHLKDNRKQSPLDWATARQHAAFTEVLDSR